MEVDTHLVDTQVSGLRSGTTSETEYLSVLQVSVKVYVSPTNTGFILKG